MKSLLLSSVMFLAITATQAQDLKPLEFRHRAGSDRLEPIDGEVRSLSQDAAGTTAGAVSKTLTNEYWRLLGEGYQNFGKKVGVPVAYQAAQSEGDQLGQLSIAETMITQGCSVLLVSPQTDANLRARDGRGEGSGIPVVNVNDAVIPQAEHYVGNVQRDNGVRVAKWFLENRPARRQGRGHRRPGRRLRRRAAHRWLQVDDHRGGGKFEVVASVPGNWDRQTSYDAATTSCSSTPI